MNADEFGSLEGSFAEAFDEVCGENYSKWSSICTDLEPEPLTERRFRRLIEGAMEDSPPRGMVGVLFSRPEYERFIELRDQGVGFWEATARVKVHGL